jgi:hypothetical protein
MQAFNPAFWLNKPKKKAAFEVDLKSLHVNASFDSNQ